MAFSGPILSGIVSGYIPKENLFSSDHKKLTLALGIIGATVMPHNLLLHSSLSQSRKINYQRESFVRQAIQFMTWDTNPQLGLAFVVNSLLLILGARLFYGHAASISAFSQMYHALNNPRIAGVIASPILSTLFAIALLASGQNSTITGTLTSEIVMKGFLNIRLPAWLLRLGTRLFALIPVIIIAFLYGSQEKTIDTILVYSQVFLSIVLLFAMFSLIYFTSQETIMGNYQNTKWLTYLSYIIAIV